MQVHQMPALTGPYGLAEVVPYGVDAVTRVRTGLCRFAKGVRSPEIGSKSSALHEIGYVVRGRLLIETALGRHEAGAGDILTTSPNEAHSTTALEDSEIFFVLLNPS